MIYQLFIFFLLIFFGAVLNYPLRLVTSQIIEYATANYPSYVTGPWVRFIQAIDYWRPLIVVLLPALIWFFVNVQRPRHPYD